tara:strand:- start:282 stop:590 length:309 start_codon:yes stop_codon:yes gene_type:complete
MTITPAAHEQLESRLSDGEFLEIGLNGGGCAGLTIVLTKTLTKPTEELSIPENGKTRWACETSKRLLTGGSLDYVNDGLMATFQIKLPLGTESCGCGASIKL